MISLHTSRPRWILSLCAIAFGCTRLVEPPLDPDAVPLAPPPVYARWWAMTKSCSGLSGSLDAVSWYVVPEAAEVGLNGDQVAGYYRGVSHSIVLAGDAVLEGAIVRHEMLHALRRRSGHSRADFLEHCGGIVTCASNCIAEAGPPPPLNPLIARISSNALELDVRIIPEHPSSMEDGGVFAIVVTAKNPRPDSVLVEGGPVPVGFSYGLISNVGGIGRSIPVVDPGVIRFAGGETKQQLFDFVIGGSFFDFVINPGLYSITGGYAASSVTKEKILIGP